MRQSRSALIYPLMKGLDKSSVPGTQDQKSLKSAKNNIVSSRGSLQKAPGVYRIPYIGQEGGIQAAIHFFATTGTGQASEIIRVRKGRVEVIRDMQVVDMGIEVSPTDTVVFERFANALIIHFENTAPVYYTIGATSLTDLGIFTSHKVSPPTFSRQHDFRLWYGGRGAGPHRIIVSAINDIEDYTLLSGGFAMSVAEGDGDPYGVTGISPTFRGDIYAYKWNSIHRIVRQSFGYSAEPVSQEIGCVHHNTIVATRNDIYHVSSDAIHSLVATDKYGAIEEATLTAPIYEYFQDSVNWSASKYMIATYDKPSNCYLLSYPSGGSSVPNKILGFNEKSKEFFEWEDIEYPVIGKYFDVGRQKTLIGDNVSGMGVLDKDYFSRFGKPINVQAKTGVVFPLNDPTRVVSFNKAWVLMRPTNASSLFNFRYWIDGDLKDTIEFDTFSDGVDFSGSVTKAFDEAVIGTDIFGEIHEELKIFETDLSGEGSGIQFELVHEPSEENPDQEFEAYGIVFNYDYHEDSDETRSL